MSHPREHYHWSDLPEGHREAMEQKVQALATAPQLRTTVESELGRAHASIAKSREEGKVPTPTQHERLEVTQRAVEHVQSGVPATGMEASVKAIHTAAMAPIHAARKLARGASGQMPDIFAGLYYPMRRKIGEKIGNYTFGKGTRESAGIQLAGPEFSARTPPPVEVRGQAGLAGVMQGGGEIGVHLSHQLADFLNKPGVVKGGQNHPPVEAGQTDFATLARHNPPTAAMLLGHGAKVAGITKGEKEGDVNVMSANKLARDAAMREGSQIEIPDIMHPAVQALIGASGQGGYPKVSRAMQLFHSNPEEFGGGDMHKVGSYTWNIHEASNDHERGLRHFLGALTHGDRWFALHPEAEGHIRRAASKSSWHDPTSTMDVWSGRLASGLPMDVSRSLIQPGTGGGDKGFTNPEMFGGFVGMGGTQKPKGHPLGKAPDLGYLYQEEAHRQAAQKMSIRLPGGGRVHAPASAVQSLSWFGAQALAEPTAFKTGQKTLVPSSMGDKAGLNPLSAPPMFRF
jgi:hypothetical protein